MSNKMLIAITQMNVTPDSLDNRLQRAEKLVHEASAQGAKLVVLPELFNTGYAYREENFIAAKHHNHTTELWMKKISAQYDVYLAGSLFYWDHGKIFNRLLFIAPSGKTWQYDKNYPWGWERAYFQAGKDVLVADTDLGRIGFMLCWDVAHPELWRKYAGKVDMILSCTCPPNIPDASYCFSDGIQIQSGELGPLFVKMQHSANGIFIETPAQQCKWLGVPYISSTGSGKIKTGIPNAKGSFMGFMLSEPGMVRHISKANELSIEVEMVEAGRIYNGDGKQLAQLNHSYEDGVCIAEVNIHHGVQAPHTPQPRPPVSGLVYFVSDSLLTAVSKGTYRCGLRNTNKQ